MHLQHSEPFLLSWSLLKKFIFLKACVTIIRLGYHKIRSDPKGGNHHMKLLIASDLHGSAKYCREFLDAYNREKPDHILLLGDLLYHGPRNALPDDYDTKETIAILNSLKNEITAVRGNCDAEVDQMVLDFPIMNEYEQLNIDGIRIFATHGHHFSPHTPPPFVEMDVLLNGHTHIPAIQQYDGFIYANPGSTSIPKAGSDHSYAILENGLLTLRHLSSGEIYESMQLK